MGEFTETPVQKEFRLVVSMMDDYFEGKDKLTEGTYKQFKDVANKR